MSRRKALAVLAGAALATGLAGCITVFPKAKPAQLYRFGEIGVPPAAGTPVATAFNVLRGPTGFTRPSATDRILTINNNEAAYIADARWVAPAAVLFDDAMLRTFDSWPSPARLVQRMDAAKADYVLRVDVRTFEARYLQGMGQPPTVVVELHAVLARTGDRALLSEAVFASQQKAADNRVGAIVPAFDAGVRDVLRQLVEWTIQTGGANLKPTPETPARSH